MIYLRELRKKHGSFTGYPFSVPVVAHTESIEFRKPVSVICGDNGCGKTTLMEILVRKTALNRIKNTAVDEFRGDKIEAALEAFTVVRQAIPKKKFFFSAEEFIKYIEWIESEKRDARSAIEEIDKEYGDNVSAANLAKMPHYETISDLNQLYATRLISVSHGEGYMDFFDARLRPEGLYLMDEPEGALTYRNQYILAMKILEAVKKDCQFIISTHSPILAAIPDADVIQIKDGEAGHCLYEQLDNIGFLEMFMRRRRRLFEFSEDDA